jgi:hypothetical protein
MYFSAFGAGFRGAKNNDEGAAYEPASPQTVSPMGKVSHLLETLFFSE